jgi:hypothetical protein
MTRGKTPPEDARRIVAYALGHPECQDCGAQPGSPCTEPGRGRSTCKSRFVSAAIAEKRERQAATRTPEQAAILASLPRIPSTEIEACRTPRGGYAFTREWFVERGLPYPPIAGWREAVEQEEG